MGFDFVDLFAGIGGFHAALRPRGGSVVLASDIDERARAIYTQNWLNEGTRHLLHGDLLPLTARRCSAIPDHDVLTAGFPCQPFSKSGRQRGVREERGQLFYSILKVLRYRRPRIVLLENVRNLAGPRHRADFEEMINLMRDLGYFVPQTPAIVSPHKIAPSRGGTPQHRERLFIPGIYVGVRRARGLQDFDLFGSEDFMAETTHDWSVGTFLKRLGTQSTSNEGLTLDDDQLGAMEAWDAFVSMHRKKTGEHRLPGFPLWTEFWRLRSRLRVPRSTPAWKRALINSNSNFYSANASWIDPWLKKARLMDYAPSLRKLEWQAGELGSLWKGLVQCRPSGIRVKRPNYTPALVAIGQSPILAWERREISVQEAAILQGFPSTMNFLGQRRSDSMRQLGNAVHVGVAGFAFDSIIRLARSIDAEWVDELQIQDSWAS